MRIGKCLPSSSSSAQAYSVGMPSVGKWNQELLWSAMHSVATFFDSSVTSQLSQV